MTLRISGTLLSAVGLATALAIGLAGSADAKSKAKKHPRSATVATPYSGPVSWHYGPRPAGLYNGQDYLGTDPDPNIRFQIQRDLSLRYGGGAD